jgi:acetyl-CoA carboxylase biotin carboxyl carrier protein
MDIRKVKKLVELMEESDLYEIEIKEGEDSVRISRQLGVQTQVTPPTVVLPIEPEKAAVTPSRGQIVNAPMVGTFYRAPSPGSPSFFEVGDRIKVGDILCIIESMKMMNQVKSEYAGTLEAVLVSNEQAVEFDQPLFTIV